MKSIEELEELYNKLQKRKYAIVRKAEKGKISEEIAQILYEPISKQVNALHNSTGRINLERK